MTLPSHAASAAPSADDLSSWIESVAQRQDRTAFAALFRHFAPRIKAYLMRAGVADGLAEDLAQDALVAVWRKAVQYDRQRAQASTWVFTIARNLRIDHLRRGQEAEWSADADALLDNLADEAPSAAESLGQARAADDVQRALATLSEDQREILRLSFFEDQPHAAIAEAMALPLGTVKSRIRLAVGHLRRQLGHLMP